jgi:Uma2 family endonuclease
MMELRRVEKMSATVAPAIQHSVLLSGIDWRTYSGLLRLLGERPIHLTYDRGELEIMTLSPEHERYKHLIGRLIEALADELSIAIAGFGSMTFRRKRKQRGLEPDECYWIANEPAVRGKYHLDFRVDPPPDLVVEVDVTSSSLDRMSIYAALGVSEVWRFDGRALTFSELRRNGKYAPIAGSTAFPGVGSSDVEGFLAQNQQFDETSVIRQFRAWVRQRVAGGGSTQP